MGNYAGHNEHQKALAKLYSQLCYRFSRHEVWQDAIWMFACAISNVVDLRHFQDRESQYLRIVQKYDEKERQVFPQLFGAIVNGMEEYPDCDFLGELYMELELGNKHGGQFFTPYHLCRAMARVNLTEDLVASEMERQGFVSINDCACGAGATLVAAANWLKEMGFDYQSNALFVAQDIDSTTALMCYIQLSLLGCPGYVIIGDTLAAPQTGHVLFGEDSSRCWFTPMFYHEAWAVRRSIATAKAMFKAVATAAPANRVKRPIASIGETETAENAQEAAVSTPAPEEAKASPAEAFQPTFTVSTGRKNEGQIMLVF